MLFRFYINRMPYLDNNITLKLLYASICSEILHITKTTTDLINMLRQGHRLLIRMKKQGTECTRIISLLNQIFWGNTFKFFISLQIPFINLLSLSLCNYLFIGICFDMHMYVYVYCLCNLFLCVYVAVYLYCSFWLDFC